MNHLPKRPLPDVDHGDVARKKIKLDAADIPDANTKKRRRKRKNRRAARNDAACGQPLSSPSGAESDHPTSSLPVSGSAAASKEELPQPSIATQLLERRVAELTKELAAKTELVQRHQTTLSHFHESLTCLLCLDVMHKPYSLSPCGHVACYECLVRWFNALPSDDAPELVPAPLPAIMRKKTCPHCRTVITQRPVEVYVLKDMVSALIKSDLVELPEPLAPDNQVIRADPWADIFHKSRDAPLVEFYDYSLSPSSPSARVTSGMGFLDHEDGGVYRCTACMHELWEGVCTACGRVYAGHRHGHDVDLDEFDDSDDGHEAPLGTRLGPLPQFRPPRWGHWTGVWGTGGSGTGGTGGWRMRGWGLEEEEDDDDDEIIRPPRRAFAQVPSEYGSDGERIRPTRVSGDEKTGAEDDDESEYERSFIDDDEAGIAEHEADVLDFIELSSDTEPRPTTVQQAYERVVASASTSERRTQVHEEDISSNSEHESDYWGSFQEPARRARLENRKRRTRARGVVESDGDDGEASGESGDEEEVVARWGRRVVVVSDKEDNEESQEEEGGNEDVEKDSETDPEERDIQRNFRESSADSFAARERDMYGEDDFVPRRRGAP